MSVNLSNRKFIFRETLDGSGGNFNVEFASKKNSSTGLSYNQMSYYLGSLTFYCKGTWSGTTVYSSGTWADADYRSITFADGASATDSQYEWLTALADEAPDPHLTTVEDLANVANAIRERGWTSQQLNFPDGYAAAVKALGNTLVGGTVGWNQLVPSINTFTASRATVSYSGNIATLTVNATGISDGRMTLSNSQSISPPQANHKYIIQAEVKSATHLSSVGVKYGNNLSAYMYHLTDGEWNKLQTMRSHSNPSGLYFQIDVYGTFTTGSVCLISNYTAIDLTILLGSTIADYLYTLESNTPGAGVAKFRELFPDDYYAYDAGGLKSKVAHEWPMNAGKTLNGIVYCEDGVWSTDGDEYNNGRVYRRYRNVNFIPATGWEYIAAGDYFRYETPTGFRGLRYIPDTNGTFITDAYPYGGNIDLAQEDPANDPTILKDGYIMQGFNTSNGVTVLYVKDSSITSDHLNTFKTKNQDKILIGLSNNFTYE